MKEEYNKSNNKINSNSKNDIEKFLDINNAYIDKNLIDSLVIDNLNSNTYESKIIFNDQSFSEKNIKEENKKELESLYTINDISKEKNNSYSYFYKTNYNNFKFDENSKYTDTKNCTFQSNYYAIESSNSKIESPIINIKNLYNLASNNKFSYSYALPIVYFIVSISTLFMLILLNFYEENVFNLKVKNFSNKIIKNPSKNPFFPFPNFYKLKSIQPHIFTVSVVVLSITGILNVWFYCSMLLQRFSVPEFRNNKILIHLMFILGIISNAMLLFFGFSPGIFILKSIKIKEIKISFSIIMYLIFIFLNILFAVIGLKSLLFLKKQIECDDDNYSRKLKMKKIILYLTLFLMLIYISAICIRQNDIQGKYINDKETFLKNKKIQNYINELILFFFPYILFIFNLFLNLGFYSDILYLQKKLTTIIDKEYFILNEEYGYLLQD